MEWDLLVGDLARKLDHTRDRRREARAAFKKAKEHLGHVAEAQVLVQTVAQQAQEHAHTQIATVVSRCLEAIFEEPYGFKIAFEKKRSKTEARMIFLRDGNEVDPKQAAGGGVLDVAAFALRLASLVLTQPAKRRVLFLDEPLRHLSHEYRGRAAELFGALAKELGVQFVVVTHFRALELGKVVTFPSQPPGDKPHPPRSHKGPEGRAGADPAG